MDSFSLTAILEVIAALLVLCLPGSALYMVAARVFGGKDNLRLLAALLPGIGLSVAFWPLLLLYYSLAGQRFSAVLIWVVLLLSLGVIVWLSAAQARKERLSQNEVVTAVALATMTLLALVFRLGDINGLAVPLFGDSLHHAMITTIIDTTGRVPTGYQPYVPVDTFTYHFGFHTLAAVLAMLAGETPPNAVLLMGQALNVMALPAGYLLCRQLFKSRLAGLAAALITGFVSVMPAYYMNWGRYTQLSGLILLPIAATMLLRAVERRSKPYETILAAFCVAGLVVVHYRILIFYGLFVIALGGWYAIANWRDRHTLILALRNASIAIAAGLLATTPWIWNLISNYLAGLTQRLKTVSSDYISSYNSAENISKYVGFALSILGLLGLILALTRFAVDRKNVAKQEDNTETVGLPPQTATLGIATWVALMLLSIWVVPGAIGSFTVAIALYIPLSLLGGYGFWILDPSLRSRASFRFWVAARLPKSKIQSLPSNEVKGPKSKIQNPKSVVPLQGLALALLAVAPVLAFGLGTWHVVDTAQFSYVHEADLKAFSWIKSNTPASAKFLISSQISYAGRGVTASDAGMWLPLLADRGVSVPALAAWTERPLQSDFFTQTRKLAAYTQPPGDTEIQRLVSKGSIPEPLAANDPQMLALMQQLGVTHVYSGTPGGASRPRLNLAAMRKDSCHYKLIYPPDNGVYIFEVNYSCK